uniref:NADH-ubiquinone oxidoreductase chain 2 n=1 Tax=Mammuthus primigenius TaxID=37349 RepID=A0A173GIU1_MAMPR|nr:NADH dehydrogenase subunit 2 [Mammuthus primigenius]ANH54983.1 NADH dehydrogenase subunit 2 [Mammuthus primigenius]APA38868.1 NADH dehydrogenase subunit 2 [Mammuthus primigenius]APA38881.1 NADH dehydrogenase subunit 2 [Mammuthus primigenius]APA38933.1 NADH dehydrogenase subunit 2 [Mammuthus primigenius]
MNPLALSLILTTLLAGTLITMMSSHWLTAWMGLEMNMLTMIPILMKTTNPRSTEAATKYFMTQATASMMLMMALTINLMYSGQWSIMKMTNPVASNVALMALMTKLGSAPFHFWVPEVTQGVELTSGMILLTWQKLAPLSLLYQMATYTNTSLIYLSGLLSILIGGWGGLNQTQLRKILAYSSISHMGWMLIILPFNPTLTLLNLAIYILLTLSIFMILANTLTTSMSSLTLMWNKTPAMTIMLMTTLLSLGGLPPLSGFTPKWLMIHELTKNNSIIMPLTMAIMTLLNMYFYMRLIYYSSLTILPSTNNMKMTWQFTNTKHTMMLPTLITLSNMLLPLTPMISMLE